jgi:hypothetical protein
MANNYQAVIKSPNDNLGIKKYAIGRTNNITTNQKFNQIPDSGSLIERTTNVDSASKIYDNRPISTKKRNNQSVTFVEPQNPVSRNLTESSQKFLNSNISAFASETDIEPTYNPDYVACDCDPCNGVCCRYPKTISSVYVEGNYTEPEFSPYPELSTNPDSPGIDTTVFIQKFYNAIQFADSANLETWLVNNGWKYDRNTMLNGDIFYAITCYGEVSSINRYELPDTTLTDLGSVVGDLPYRCLNNLGDKVCDDTIETKYECESVGGTWYSFASCEDDPCVSPTPTPTPSPS